MYQRTLEYLPKKDKQLWICGIIFIIIFDILTYVLGHLRGWKAFSAYNHVGSSVDRFLPEPSSNEFLNVSYRSYGNSSDAFWYYWQTKPWDRNFFSHFLPWAGYAGHQFSVWWLTFKAQLKHSKYENESSSRFSSYSDGRRVNQELFLANCAFYRA